MPFKASNTCRLSWGCAWIAALLRLAANAGAADTATRGFYMAVEAGPAFATEAELREFGERVAGAKIDFDVGARLDLRGGYDVNGWLGVEVETGAIYNRFNDLDGSLTQVPLLANVVVRYDRPGCRWVPFAGAGAGVDFAAMTLNGEDAPDGSILDGTDVVPVGCYQAFAGLHYRISERTSLGLGYKFQSTIGNTAWDLGGFLGSSDIEIGPVRVHSLVLTFNLKF